MRAISNPQKRAVRQSGGRPKGYVEFAEAARRVSMEGIETVYEMAKKTKESPIRLGAWKLLFESGYGRPVMPVLSASRASVAVRGSLPRHQRARCERRPAV